MPWRMGNLKWDDLKRGFRVRFRSISPVVLGPADLGHNSSRPVRFYVYGYV